MQRREFGRTGLRNGIPFMPPARTIRPDRHQENTTGQDFLKVALMANDTGLHFVGRKKREAPGVTAKEGFAGTVASDLPHGQRSRDAWGGGMALAAVA